MLVLDERKVNRFRPSSCISHLHVYYSFNYDFHSKSGAQRDPRANLHMVSTSQKYARFLGQLCALDTKKIAHFFIRTWKLKYAFAQYV